MQGRKTLSLSYMHLLNTIKPEKSSIAWIILVKVIQFNVTPSHMKQETVRNINETAVTQQIWCILGLCSLKNGWHARIRPELFLQWKVFRREICTDPAAFTRLNSSELTCGWILMSTFSLEELFLWTRILVKNVLMLDLFQLLSSPDVNWWNGVLWIIVMFLSGSRSDGTHSLQSIHCWWNDISPYLMKKQTHPNPHFPSKCSFLGGLFL